MIFEYIRIVYDGTLDQLNALASTGWRLAGQVSIGKDTHMILERPVPMHRVQDVRDYYANPRPMPL